MRVAVVTFGYSSQNIRLLPWRYLHEVAKHLLKLDQEVVVITDGYPTLPRKDEIAGVPVIRLRHIKPFPPCNFDEIAETLARVDPDAVLWLMGLTSFFQKKLYERLRYTIVAVIGSPVYSIVEILRNLNGIDIVQNARVLITSFIEALIPRRLVRNTFNSNAIKTIVTMSERNRERLGEIGVKSDKLNCVLPGIDVFFLERPSFEEIRNLRNEICGDLSNCFLLTYIGPPLSIRGIDTFLLALRLTLEKGFMPSCFRVLILSREMGKEYRFQEERMLGLVSNFGLSKVVKIKRGFLDKDEVKLHLAASDLVVLPFKHVISDTPISILESMSLGVPVLSTYIDGIPEWLEDERGLIINPGDFEHLAELISHYLKNIEKLRKYGETARRYILGKPDWKGSANAILDLLKGSARVQNR